MEGRVPSITGSCSLRAANGSGQLSFFSRVALFHVSPDLLPALVVSLGLLGGTMTGVVTGFSIGRDGSLDMLDANGVTGTTGAAPSDLGTSAHGTYLYVLAGGADAISAFRVAKDGHLTAMPGVSGLPMPGVGLAAS